MIWSISALARRLSAPRISSDAISIFLLMALAIWLFRGHVFGDSLWIGNPDRLNSDLKTLAHYLSGLGRGGISAWNEHEMMGYDSFVLPYTAPNPVVYLVALFGGANLYVTMGYVAVAMLAAAGLAAYAFLRTILPAGLPALVGAVCYEFSSLTVLKVSQNSMSFAVFIAIPLLLLIIRHIRRENAAGCFLALTVLFSTVISLMFLQKVAYAVLLAGSYAAWRSMTERSWRPAFVFAAALALAVVFSLPRVLGIAEALGEYARVVAGLNMKNFEDLYLFQNIKPYEIYRWFDNSIFGRNPSEAGALGSSINLTEGFLLYTSTVVPLVLLTSLTRGPLVWLNVFRGPRREAAFFFWALAACVAVVVAKPVTHAVFLLFLGVDFTHARILIAGLLPLSALLALSLTGLAPQAESDAAALRTGAFGVAIGLLAAFAIEAIATRFAGTYLPTDLPPIRRESLARIGLSALLYLTLLGVIERTKWVSLRRAAHVAICSLIVSQCMLGADQQVNGQQAFNFLQPFKKGDFYQARREEFRPPSAEQLRMLHRRIEPERYRVALICDPDIAGGFCAGHVPEFWQLRSVDGYYGLGVPRRLRSLPWKDGLSLRTISFVNLKDVPWDLLGLLNVRSVLISGNGVFRNIVRDGERITGRADPADFQVVPSPARVTPRAFFSGTVKPAASPEDAAEQLFASGRIVDPMKTSFVEGLREARRFDGGGEVDVQSRGDSLTLRFSASSSERFLVLNELYYPGWTAEAGGRELPILATNAVMRGIVVPPDVDTVRFHYLSYLSTTRSWVYRIAAVLIMLGLYLTLRRYARR